MSLRETILTDELVAGASPLRKAPLEDSDRRIATLGAVASFGAFFSAAACCVLPLALGAVGLGAGGLSAIVPFHWPLTIAAIAAVAAGWFLYLRKRRACVGGGSCTAAAPSRATFVTLCAATAFVIVSAFWGLVEAPLMRLLSSWS